MLVLGQTSGDLRIVRASPGRLLGVVPHARLHARRDVRHRPDRRDGRLYLRNLREMAAFSWR